MTDEHLCKDCKTPEECKKKRIHVTQTGINSFSAIINSALFIAIILLLFQTREELVELRTTIVERYVKQEQLIEDVDEIKSFMHEQDKRMNSIERDVDILKSEQQRDRNG